MRKLFLAAAVALLALLPATGHAQQQQKPGDMFGLNSSQVVAIGVGIVGGVIVAEAAAVSMPAWAGALAGGLIGNWWYSQQAEQMKATASRTAAAFTDEAKLYLANANEYATNTIDTVGQWIARPASE